MTALEIEMMLQVKFYRDEILDDIVDPPVVKRPELMSPQDTTYLRNLIIKVSGKIAAGTFRPKLINGASDCLMHSIVPIKSFTRRHIPITREEMHSLLHRSGYRPLPSARIFLNDNEAAAAIYWDVFDFRRMNFESLQEFRGQRRCFDFRLDSDGFAFSAHFTRPAFEPGEEIKPQDIRRIDGDEVYFVDPGQTMCFTAMKGLGSAANPSPIIKLSNSEYYTMAGLNITSKSRLDRKIFEANLVGAANSVQRIESLMPTIKTVNAVSIAAFLAYNALHYQRLADFYDERFNRWKFMNYSGKQRALSEARYLYSYMFTIYCM
jgi:hypothetical protein